MANDRVAIWDQTLKLARSPANGELLIGNSDGFNLATLTAGSGVTISNASGQITINATGTGGTVTSVTATSPLVSSGGTTPDISLGTVTVDKGGTGATSLTLNNVLLGNGASAVQFVAPGASGNVLTSNGTTWASSALGGLTVVRVSSDTSSTSSSSNINISGLAFSVDANSNYVFTAYIYITFPAAAGFRISTTAPTGTTGTVGGVSMGNSNSVYPETATITSIGTGALFNTTNANTSAFAQVQGFFSTGSNAGTLQFTGAQTATNATATVFKAGSWVQYAKV